MAKVRGGQVKSLAALKKSVKRSSGSGMITRIPKDAPLTVRFLEEPDRWFEYFEHFDTSTNKGFICIDGECPGCADDMRQSKRFLANAVNTDTSTVIALQMPTSLVTTLLKRYDKYGTVLDRNWELSKSGSGLDTEYDADAPDGKSRFNLSIYEPLDLGDVLQSQIASDGGEDDEDDDTPPWEKDEPTKPAKRTGLSRRNLPPPPDDEEDEDDEDEASPPRRSLSRTTAPTRKLAPPATRTLKKAPPAAKTLGGIKRLGR